MCVVKGDKVTATKFNKRGVTILLQRFYSNIFVSLNDAGGFKEIRDFEAWKPFIKCYFCLDLKNIENKIYK